jgi:hypothetical protein
MKTPLRVLLDENLPIKLKYRIITDDFHVSTVRDENWLGKKNGELLRLMQNAEFTVLISNDKHLTYQQNVPKFSLIVLYLKAASNRYDDLLPIVPNIQKALSKIKSEIDDGQIPQFLELRNIDSLI